MLPRLDWDSLKLPSKMFHVIMVSWDPGWGGWNQSKHSLKLTANALKIGHPKRKFIFQPSLFRCKLAVSFRECKHLPRSPDLSYLLLNCFQVWHHLRSGSKKQEVFGIQPLVKSFLLLYYGGWCLPFCILASCKVYVFFEKKCTRNDFFTCLLERKRHFRMSRAQQIVCIQWDGTD